MTRLGFKIVAIVFLTLGLFVPLAMLLGLIHERAGYRRQAREDIARSWTGEQTVHGPVLAVPVRASAPEDGADRDDGPTHLLVLPETLEVEASLRTEMRKRGLYAVPVYTTRLTLAGEFDLSGALAAEAVDPRLETDGAFLALSLSDNRGIVSQPVLDWAGATPEISAGPALEGLGQGVHALVGPLEPARYEFRMELELRGMETLLFSPVARDTRVTLDAGWPHPSFVGGFLPVEYEIDSERFRAEWRVSGLATGWREPALGGGAQVRSMLATTFGVSLIDPVDIYQLATRSVKYGNLIVLLTFTAFFLIETVRRLMLHPLQYLLIGLALVIFFLLLLALSEHMAFWIAYLVAALACVGLIAVYTASALGSVSGAIGATTILGVLYGMLYVILESEDNALLMGSLLLFAALAAVMLITRRIDWYRMGRELQPPAAVAQPAAEEGGVR